MGFSNTYITKKSNLIFFGNNLEYKRKIFNILNNILDGTFI